MTEMNSLNWDIAHEADKQPIEEARRKQYEIDHNFHKTFSTASGKIVLEWLISHTLDTPTWWPDADYNKAVANGFFREGQNCLVRQIKDKIKRAKEYQESNK